jgi:hypothetical protein
MLIDLNVWKLVCFAQISLILFCIIVNIFCNECLKTTVGDKWYVGNVNYLHLVVTSVVLVTY